MGADLTVTPAGPLALPQERLRTLIANTAEWQSWTGTTTPGGADDSIYHAAIPRPSDGTYDQASELDALRPFILLGTADDGFRRERISGAGPFGATESGTLTMQVEQTAQHSHPGDAEIDFLNRLGRLISDMWGLSGNLAAADHFRIVEIEMPNAPERASEDEVKTSGDYQLAVLAVSWSTT